MNKRIYYQLIPEKIEENLYTIGELIRPEISGFSVDSLKEVISIVAYNVRKAEEEEASLKMTYIKRLVPQGDKYLNALRRLGVVNRSGYYIPGEIAYKYKFSPAYESKFVASILSDQKLIRRIEKAHHFFQGVSASSVRGHSDQIKYLNELTIQKDFIRYLEANYTADTDAYNCALASATRILNGDIFYNIDSTSMRFHSNVTNTPKWVRQFLRVNGEPLCNIDIKNSQPYLSVLILTNPSKVARFTDNSAFAMFLQTLKVPQREDVTKYINLVIEGRLYEYLMEAFTSEGLVLDRDMTKKQVLRILYAPNRTPINETNRKARQIFEARFPTVHETFSRVRGNEKGDKFTSYKRFAILLQRVESHLILDVVIKRICREFPGVVVLTIHDSIMTGILTNRENEVMQILTEELKNYVGYPPTIKVERGEEEGKREKGIFSYQYDATTSVNFSQSNI